MQKDFALKLLTLLKEKKLSQKEFARLLNAKEPLISRWITGKAKPNDKSLIAICDALKLSYDYFKDDTDDISMDNSKHRLELLEEKVRRLELEIELLKRSKK